MINKTLIRIIKIYQRYLSPILGQNCRFSPTCSQYALEALKVHGTYRGSILAVKRIIRCNPWGGCGIDNVPGESKYGRD
tara:strand:+ start:113 stop:349 length:237 start_codon:yes stop_codon:yes gene_type:complete